MPWFEKSGSLKNRGFEKIGIPLYNAMFFQRLFLQSVLIYFTFNLPFLVSLGQWIHISHSHHKGFRLGKRLCIMSLGKFPLAGTKTDVLQLFTYTWFILDPFCMNACMSILPFFVQEW